MNLLVFVRLLNTDGCLLLIKSSDKIVDVRILLLQLLLDLASQWSGTILQESVIISKHAQVFISVLDYEVNMNLVKFIEISQNLALPWLINFGRLFLDSHFQIFLH